MPKVNGSWGWGMVVVDGESSYSLALGILKNKMFHTLKQRLI